MFNVNAVAYGSLHPSDANYPTVELAALREVTRQLADLLGLTMPASCGKQALQRTGHQPHRDHTIQTLQEQPPEFLNDTLRRAIGANTWLNHGPNR